MFSTPDMRFLVVLVVISLLIYLCVCAQSCLTLCDGMDFFLYIYL